MINCPTCGHTVIGEAERIAAKDIIVKLRKTFECQDVAHMLRIKEIYVSLAMGMHQNDFGKYMCPKSAIIATLEWGLKHAR